jgi:hypothetical protein
MRAACCLCLAAASLSPAAPSPRARPRPPAAFAPGRYAIAWGAETFHATFRPDGRYECAGCRGYCAAGWWGYRHDSRTLTVWERPLYDWYPDAPCSRTVYVLGPELSGRAGPDQRAGDGFDDPGSDAVPFAFRRVR